MNVFICEANCLSLFFSQMPVYSGSLTTKYSRSLQLESMISRFSCSIQQRFMLKFLILGRHLEIAKTNYFLKCPRLIVKLLKFLQLPPISAIISLKISIITYDSILNSSNCFNFPINFGTIKDLGSFLQFNDNDINSGHL